MAKDDESLLIHPGFDVGKNLVGNLFTARIPGVLLEIVGVRAVGDGVFLHVGIRGVRYGGTCPRVVLTIYEDQMLLGGLQILYQLHLQVDGLRILTVLHLFLQACLFGIREQLAIKQPIALKFEDFITSNDVEILDADTTQIAVILYIPVYIKDGYLWRFRKK